MLCNIVIFNCLLCVKNQSDLLPQKLSCVVPSLVVFLAVCHQVLLSECSTISMKSSNILDQTLQTNENHSKSYIWNLYESVCMNM